MPGGDRTGPVGRGPRTGRGFGFCSGYPSPGYTVGQPRGGIGFGRGWGRGFGRGFRSWNREYYPYSEPPTPKTDENEKQYLEALAHDLEEELKNIKNKIQELSNNKKQES